jgi:hypothetical protein
MAFTMTEHKRIAAKRQVMAIMQAPQGRDLGRLFLEEIGKGDRGDLPGAFNETAELFVEVWRELYAANQPVQSR